MGFWMPDLIYVPRTYPIYAENDLYNDDLVNHAVETLYNCIAAFLN